MEVRKESEARSNEERRRILLDWWARAKPPYIDIAALTEQLHDGHRWRRIVAARALASAGATDLLDPVTGDVDPAAAQRFRDGPPDEPA